MSRIEEASKQQREIEQGAPPEREMYVLDKEEEAALKAAFDHLVAKGQDALEDKDEIIAKLKAELELLNHQYNEVVGKNQRLRDALEEKPLIRLYVNKDGKSFADAYETIYKLLCDNDAIEIIVNAK